MARRELTPEERAELARRTREGMARARAAGQKLGRPRVSPMDLSNAVDFLERGYSVIEAAALAGVGETSLRRHLEEALRAEEEEANQQGDQTDGTGRDEG